MGSVFDYISEYGRLDFEEKPFNEVDGLILSQFSYLKMDGIVPGPSNASDAIELRDIAVSKSLDDMFTDERYAKNNRQFFDALASSRRFGLIKLNHYINLVNKKWEMQFSAVCCEISNGTTCVIYRGTDETLIGWKEDFNMAYLTPIPAQLKAVDYLRYVSERISGGMILAGHSKGGNLAVYSAMKAPKEIKDRITSIISYDGPGFLKETLECSEFGEIKSKIRKFVPHSSIVGMLLQSQEEYRVVEAKSFGILQHDPFNWVVEDDSFIYRDDVSEAFRFQNEIVNEWAIETDSALMHTFGDQLLDILIKCGINDLNDFKGNAGEILKKLTVALSELDDENKDIMVAVIKQLITIVIEAIKAQPGIIKINDKDKTDRRNT